jgi:ubiquinone/menaquinone biosynthesis C-methylase UbiE
MAMTADQLSVWVDSIELRPSVLNANILVAGGTVPHENPNATAQFLENADLYHSRYFNPSLFKPHIKHALDVAGFKAGPAIACLDLGSGSGNTVVPLLELFPQLSLIATDISPNILSIMDHILSAQKHLSDRVGYICADASVPTFKSGSFDLVTGAAILHHLFDARKAVELALTALKPGGIALFMEPFEYGNGLLKIIYQRILDHRPSSDQQVLDPKLAKFFRAMICDWEHRFDPLTAKPHTQYLDDKWLFTEEFFNGFLSLSDIEDWQIIQNPLPLDHLFEQSVAIDLSLTGIDAALPDWAVSIIRKFDAGMSNDLKADLPREATLIFKKKAA